MKKFFYTASLHVLFILKVISQPGLLDPEFGSGGIVTTLFNNDTVTCFSEAIAIQNDGKIIVAGYAEINEKVVVALFRHQPDGSPDHSFGINGLTLLAIGDYIFSSARDVIIQDDGKILVAGEVYDGLRSDFAVSRYNTNGTPDPEFGIRGFVTTTISNPMDIGDGLVSSMAIQEDGKILVAGVMNLPAERQIAMVRYYPNGFQDDTFGDRGVVTKPFGGWVRTNSVLIQQNGRILIGGSAGSSTQDPSFAMVRFRSNGTVDNSFGIAGTVITDVGENSSIEDLAKQDDNKIVVAGTSYSLGEQGMVIARYHENGKIDSTFGPDGMINTNVADLLGYASSLVIQDNGRILVAGQTLLAEFAIVCLDSSGLFDENFGNDGVFILSGSPDNYFGSSIALAEDGNIILAGTVYSVNQHYYPALAGIDPAGKLLNTFGNDGIVFTTVGSGNYTAQSMAIQDDGKIIVSGYSFEGYDSEFFTIRYNKDGSIDQSFGSEGVVIDNISPSADIINVVALQKDGKIVVAGYSSDSNAYHNCTLARYDSDGKTDATFGTGGIVIISLSMGYDVVSDIGIRENGKIVIAAATDNEKDFDFALIQLDDHGNLDGTFGTNGKVFTDIALTDVTYDLELQTDGKIIVSGVSESSEGFRVALIRYLQDGSLDQTFGVKGIVSIGDETEFNGSPVKTILQPDGKIVVGTTSTMGNDYDFWLCRINPEGTFDNSFGINGSVITGSVTTGSSESLTSLAQCILPNGEVKIIASGYTYLLSHSDFAIVAYNSDGSVDPHFNFLTSIGSSQSYSLSSIVQDDGKVVLAGVASDNDNRSAIALARYIGFADTPTPIVKDVDINAGASLVQNYPNPYSNYTIIGWSVSVRNHVVLKVYDIVGNEVATLFDGIQMPGEYEILFDSEGLSEGLYYYTLIIDSVPVETRKMVLLR